MKGLIICKNDVEFDFSRDFKERWFQLKYPDREYPYSHIICATIPVDETALEIFDHMGAEWSADSRYELEMYEISDDIFNFVLIENDYGDGQRLIIDWKEAAVYISKICTKKERFALTEKLLDYDKFLSEEFP